MKFYKRLHCTLLWFYLFLFFQMIGIGTHHAREGSRRNEGHANFSPMGACKFENFLCINILAFLIRNSPPNMSFYFELMSSNNARRVYYDTYGNI